MQSTRRSHRTNTALVQAILLGILALVAVAVALVALAVPDVNIELPVAPTFTVYPVSPHAGT